jgi:hypothetical protein
MKKEDNNCIEIASNQITVHYSNESNKTLVADETNPNANKKEDEEVLKWLKTGWDNKEA